MMGAGEEEGKEEGGGGRGLSSRGATSRSRREAVLPRAAPPAPPPAPLAAHRQAEEAEEGLPEVGVRKVEALQDLVAVDGAGRRDVVGAGPARAALEVVDGKAHEGPGGERVWRRWRWRG